MSDLFGLSEEGRKALRYYQEEATAAAVDLYNQQKNSVIICATGTGKTIIGAEIIRRIAKPTLWIAHRENLLDAAIQKIHAQTGIVPHKEKAKYYANRKAEIVCGSVQSMQRDRLKTFSNLHFEYGIVDEAHHAVANTYRNILDYFSFNHTGLTATPDRKDDKHLNDIYDAIAYEYPLHKAIKEGHLVPIKGYKVKDFDIDLSQLRIVAGDFQDRDLEEVISRDVARISESIKEQSEGLKTLCFCPTVESARIMAEAMNAIGVSADYVAGNKNNDKAFYDFHVGNISHLFSVDMVLEGYDEPSIQALVILRPTGSRIVYSQMVGRGTRLHPGKDHIKLIEFTFNSDRLKLVSPFELFSTAGYGEMVQGAAEEAASRSDSIDYMQLLDEANEMMYSVKGILGRLIKPATAYGFTEFNPVAFGDLLGVDITGEFDIHYNGRKLTGRATDKQKDILKRFGVSPKDEVDKAQASLLIGKIFEKEYIPYKGPATVKQKEILRRYGVNTENMMKAQATVLIEQIRQKSEAQAIAF